MNKLLIIVILKTLILQAICVSLDQFTIEDCLADNESTNEINEDKNTPLIHHKHDCNTINSLLSNCSCEDDYIDCSNKGFTSIPHNLTQLPIGITRLLFAKNSIKSLNKINLNNNTRITVLNLNKNQINSIDDSFFDNLANNLNYLSFCGNYNLTSFTQIKQNFSNLDALELNNLKELSIQNGFFTQTRFPKLTLLNLNNANLKISSKPFELVDLTTMRLDSNNLDSLPCESFSLMSHLQTLNLTKNNLNNFKSVAKSCWSKLISLEKLYLKSNKLTEENLVSFDFSSKLTILDLSDNKFTKLPYASLRSAKSLMSLRLSVNEEKFTLKPDKNDIYWPNLSYLDLSNSNIDILTDYAFANFSSELADLILTNCKLKQIKPDAFAGLNKLTHLDLSNNLLQTLNKPSDDNKFDYKLLNGNIKLKNNNFKCNQLDVEWFFQIGNYPAFDKNLTCSLLNDTKLNLFSYLQTHRIQPDKPTKSTNILGIILLILIALLIATTVFYLVRRKQVKQRQQQYRYRFFTERQDDGFDTDNVPVYRDCTVSLRIKDTDETNNSTNNFNSNLDTSSTAALTEPKS